MENYTYWQKELELDNVIKLKGYSRGGYKTGFIIFPYKIFLDAGITSLIEPNAIIITHGHQDHIDALYNHLMDNNTKAIVICSYNLLPFLQEYLNSNKSLNMLKRAKFNNWIPKPFNNSIVEVIICNKKFRFEPIRLDHEVETFGYGISEIRNKLLDIYKDKSQEEIIEIKKLYKITEEKIFPIIFFCGDMSYKSLGVLPFLYYPYFLIECTFFEEEHIEMSKNKKHLHIKFLEPYFKTYENTKFILIHFSCRYTFEQLKYFENVYCSKYSNIIFWL
jgi:ribonuclease BN (tRNA processing enzyme)